MTDNRIGYVEVPSSPLVPDRSPARLGYRDMGEGPALVFLHGGWGYDIYAFDRQAAALSGTYRILAPDRSGYGRSGEIRIQPVDFHERAARETLALLDAVSP